MFGYHHRRRQEATKPHPKYVCHKCGAVGTHFKRDCESDIRAHTGAGLPKSLLTSITEHQAKRASELGASIINHDTGWQYLQPDNDSFSKRKLEADTGEKKTDGKRIEESTKDIIPQSDLNPLQFSKEPDVEEEITCLSEEEDSEDESSNKKKNEFEALFDCDTDSSEED